MPRHRLRTSVLWDQQSSQMDCAAPSLTTFGPGNKHMGFLSSSCLSSNSAAELIV